MLHSNLQPQRVFIVGDNSFFEEGIPKLLACGADLAVSGTKYTNYCVLLDAVVQYQPVMISSLRASGHRVTLFDPLSSFYETGKLTWLGNIDTVIARWRFFGLLQKLGWVEMLEEPTPFNDRRISVASIYNETEQTARIGDK